MMKVLETKLQTAPTHSQPSVNSEFGSCNSNSGRSYWNGCVFKGKEALKQRLRSKLGCVCVTCAPNLILQARLAREKEERQTKAASAADGAIAAESSNSASSAGSTSHKRKQSDSSAPATKEPIDENSSDAESAAEADDACTRTGAALSNNEGGAAKTVGDGEGAEGEDVPPPPKKDRTSSPDTTQ